MGFRNYPRTSPPPAKPIVDESKRVDELTDQQLLAAIEQRKQRAREERIAKLEEIIDMLQVSDDVQRFCRLILKQHDRTTCADDNVCNVGRCQRCNLLDVIAGNDLGDGRIGLTICRNEE